jgi:hypothetical protein
MDGSLIALEDLIEWIDDRFGRAAAWVAGVLAILALTVGAIAVAFAALAHFGR